jgi:hypothetical protein
VCIMKDRMQLHVDKTMKDISEMQEGWERQMRYLTEQIEKLRDVIENKPKLKK